MDGWMDKREGAREGGMDDIDTKSHVDHKEDRCRTCSVVWWSLRFRSDQAD